MIAGRPASAGSITLALQPRREAPKRLLPVLHRVYPLQKDPAVGWITHAELELEQLVVQQVAHAPINCAAFEGLCVLLKAKASQT